MRQIQNLPRFIVDGATESHCVELIAETEEFELYQITDSKELMVCYFNDDGSGNISISTEEEFLELFFNLKDLEAA